jgi:hypothetical protein
MDVDILLCPCIIKVVDMWSCGYFEPVKVYPDSMVSSEDFGCDFRGVTEVDDEFAACGTFSG